MNKDEVFKAITSEHKWYLGYCSQGYATQLIQRFEDGRLSDKTIEKLFNHFGYFVLRKTEWANHNTYFTENTSFIDRNFIEDIFESLNNVTYVVVPYCKKLIDKDATLLKNIGLDYDYDESSCLRIFRKQLDGKPKELKTK